MATVEVRAGVANGGLGTAGDPKNLKEAAAAWLAGDVIECQTGGGAYTGANDVLDSVLNTVGNGAAGNYVLIRKKPADPGTCTFGLKVDLSATSYLDIRDIRMESAGLGWVRLQGDSHHLRFVNLTFHSTAKINIPHGFLVTAAHDVVIDGCSVLDWSHTDAFMFRGVGTYNILLDNLDASQARVAHSLLAIETQAHSIIVRNPILRNRVSRSLQFSDNGDSANAPYDLLLEGVIFAADDWDGVVAAPPGMTISLGAAESARFGCKDTIVRNSLFLAHNPGESSSFAASMSAKGYKGNRTWSGLRFHHCVFYRMLFHGIWSNKNSLAPVVQAGGNKWKSCIFDLVENYIVNIDDEEIPFQTWEFDSSVLADDVLTELVRLRTASGVLTLTVAGAMAQYPSVFKNLVTTRPLFADEDKIDEFIATPASLSIADYTDLFDAYKLQAGSAGKAGGSHVTRTSAAGTTTVTVPVEDARWFTSRWGIEDSAGVALTGDMVLIGANSAVEVTDRDIASSPNTLTVGTAITFEALDKIFLEDETNQPDMGLMGMATGGDPPPPDELPPEAYDNLIMSQAGDPPLPDGDIDNPPDRQQSAGDYIGIPVTTSGGEVPPGQGAEALVFRGDFQGALKACYEPTTKRLRVSFQGSASSELGTSNLDAEQILKAVIRGQPAEIRIVS